MKKPLQILHLEDNKNDVELVKEILSIERIECSFISTDNREDFIRILKENEIDLILADYSLPSFDGLSALKLVLEMGYDLPFILVSAVLGEELAIEAMQSGATDYILKSRMERLVPAIRRALREVEERDKRIRLEKNISILENQYQKIAERIRGFLKMDLPSGKFSLVDQFIEELSGYSIDEWYQTPNFIKKIIHPDFTDYYYENFKKMEDGFVPKMLEYKIIQADGEERWWLQFNIGAYDFNQRLISVSIVIIDNTETKETNLKYQNLFENALAGMYRTDIESGLIIEANETMANIFGYKSIEELKSITAKALYPSESSRLSFIKEITEKGFVKGYQMQLRRKDEKLIWVKLSAKIYPSEGFIEGVIIDISEEKKIQQELYEREQELENIFEHKGAATLIIDEDLKVIRCNHQLEVISGYKREEIEGKKNWPDFVHPDDIQRLIDFHYKRRKDESKTPTSYECKLIHKSGKILTAYLTVGLIPGTKRSIASFFDITEKNLAEEALQRDRTVFKLIAESAVQSIDLRDLCQKVLIGLVENMNFDSGSIQIYYENERVLMPMAEYGLNEEAKQFLGHISIDNKELPLTQFISKEIFAPDVKTHEFLRNTDIYSKYNYQTFISWPIFNANKKFLGSLQVGSFNKKNLSEDDRYFFTNITNIFATAIERKMSDEALRESEGQYRNLVESLPAHLGLLILQKNEIQYASPTIFEMLKIKSIRDIIGSNVLQYFVEKNHEEIIFNMNLVFEINSGRSPIFETTLKRTTKEEFPCEVIVTLTTYRGDPAVQLIIWEITDRKQAEEKIRENEEKYRSLVETSPSAIALIDLSGVIQFINKHALEIFRVKNDNELIGKDLYSHIIEPQISPLKELFNQLLEDNERKTTELVFLRKDNTSFQGELTASIIKDSKGEPNAFIAIMQDITQRKEFERHRRLLANIVENSKEVVISSDENGKIIFANSPLEDVFGYKPEEIIGKSINILAPPGTEQIQKNLFKSIPDVGKTTFEGIRKHKDGSLIPVIMTLTHLKDIESNTSTINAIIVDISDLKKLQATLKDRSYELETLNKIISAGYIARNMDELLDFTLTTILNTLDFNGGAIYLIDEKNKVANIKRSLGMSVNFVSEAQSMPLSHTAFKKLLIEGKTVFVENYMDRSDGHKESGIHTLIGVPFFSKQKVIGCLILSTKEKRSITKDDLNALEAIGREIGTTITKMQTEEELIGSQKDLQIIFDAIEDSIIVFESNSGQILNFNKAVQEKLGYSQKALLKMSFYDLLPENKKTSFNSIIKKIISGKTKEAPITLQTNNGGIFTENYIFHKTKVKNNKAIVAQNTKS
ncbi:MAG: PAS domain S-box protein [Candidatus Heimdallarchaeota archaeon]|nr:PAS domain S-box protein [Candidatus Heimdallarchaeota archaeon]